MKASSDLHVFSERAHFAQLLMRSHVVHEHDIVDELDPRITHFELITTAVKG